MTNQVNEIRKIRAHFELETNIKVRRDDPASEQAFYAWMELLEQRHAKFKAVARLFPQHSRIAEDKNLHHRIDTAQMVYKYLASEFKKKKEQLALNHFENNAIATAAHYKPEAIQMTSQSTMDVNVAALKEAYGVSDEPK